MLSSPCSSWSKPSLARETRRQKQTGGGAVNDHRRHRTNLPWRLHQYHPQQDGQGQAQVSELVPMSQHHNLVSYANYVLAGNTGLNTEQQHPCYSDWVTLADVLKQAESPWDAAYGDRAAVADGGSLEMAMTELERLGPEMLDAAAEKQDCLLVVIQSSDTKEVRTQPKQQQQRHADHFGVRAWFARWLGSHDEDADTTITANGVSCNRLLGMDSRGPAHNLAPESWAHKKADPTRMTDLLDLLEPPPAARDACHHGGRALALLGSDDLVGNGSTQFTMTTRMHRIRT